MNVEKEKVFTLTTLAEYLNEKYKKKTGGQFTVSDVQGYIQRGYLPLYLEDQKVFVRRTEIKGISGIKFYKLVRKFNNVQE